MRKTKKNDSGGGGANWMDTYGDMVTLLLTFFVMLYSFSTIDAEKWERLVTAFSGGKGVLQQQTGALDKNGAGMGKKNTEGIDQNKEKNPEEQLQEQKFDAEKFAQDQENADKLFAAIKAYVEANNLDNDINLSRNSVEILIRFSNNVLFESGKAELNERAYNILGEIAKMINQYNDTIKMIRIEGHTDNVPIATRDFPTNWELSTDRAVCVLRYMLSNHGIQKDKISAVGYGEEHPVADNSTEVGRMQNRRVDFVISVIK